MIMLDIDMPKSCSDCPLTAYSDMYVEDYCTVNGNYDEDKRPDDCPIVAQVEQEPCEDCISREQAIKSLSMLFDNNPDCEEWNKAIQAAVNDLKHHVPSVTPQELGKDEVILTKEEYGKLVSSEFDNGYAKGFREALEQEPKTGRWLDWTDDRNDYLKCSICGYGEEGEVKFGEYTPYCPMCGAKMESEE